MDGVSVPDAERRLRIDLAAAFRMVARLGLDDLIYNHISVRVPGAEGQFLINPYGLLFSELTASDLVRIDVEGNKLCDSPHEVNLAGFIIHSAIHGAREDAVCVLHTHSDALVAVSALPEGLLPLSQFAMWFHRRLAWHDYEGVAIDADERGRLVRDLGPHRAMLMRNHGILTVGRTVGEAFMLLYYAERAARIQLKAQSASGGRPLVLPPEEVCEKAARQFWEQQGDIRIPGEREWPALLRDLDRADPGYRS